MNPFFLRQPFYFLPPDGLTKGISSCGKTVVKGAMHHLQRRESLRVSLPHQQQQQQQQQRYADSVGFVSVGCGHVEKENSNYFRNKLSTWLNTTTLVFKRLYITVDEEFTLHYGNDL